VRAVDDSAAANKVLAVLIPCPGVRACLPGGGVVAATAKSRRSFVLAGLLLPWWCDSTAARGPGEICAGGGRRRALTSSGGLLPWSRGVDVMVVASSFFPDGFGWKEGSQALRGDGISPADKPQRRWRCRRQSTFEVHKGADLQWYPLRGRAVVSSSPLSPATVKIRRRSSSGCAQGSRGLDVIFLFLWVLCACFRGVLSSGLFQRRATRVVISRW
jgi:hypothetical protein